MNYGGTNNIRATCMRCSQSPDTHQPFKYIQSGDTTEGLVKKLQGLLTDNALKPAVQEVEQRTTTGMLGAAVATIGSDKRTYLTISGYGATLFKHVDKGKIGKDVILVDDVNALSGKQQLPNNPTAVKKDSSLGREFTPVAPVAQNNNRDYPVGSCAAQKLIARIYRDALDKKTTVSGIEMAELLWFDSVARSDHNRDWSTGSIVMSCDTCKQVVQQMLCSNLS